MLGQKQHKASRLKGDMLAPNFSLKANAHSQAKPSINYYPFGSSMVGYSNEEFGYKYKHQRQESDDEVYGAGAAYIYTYRMSDSRYGRFWSVDPLKGKYPYYSPYSFSGNRVIDMIELEGLEPTSPEYLWKPEHVTQFSHGTRYKVDDWWVFVSTNNECQSVHQYWDPKDAAWKEFIPIQPTSLASEILDNMQYGAEAVVKYGEPVILVVGGIVAIGAAIPTGGASIGAFATSFTVISGSYAIAAGSAKLILNIAGQEDLAEKLPSGYLNATVGITIRYTVGNKEVVDVIEGVLSVTEASVTITSKAPDMIQKIANLNSATNAIIESVIVINDVVDMLNESNKESNNQDGATN